MRPEKKFSSRDTIHLKRNSHEGPSKTKLVTDIKGEEEEEGGEEGRDRPLTATETRKLAREWRARQGSVVFIHFFFCYNVAAIILRI
jgi:hypothetical protein